jgi:predicted HAD superfamily hydrolase
MKIINSYDLFDIILGRKINNQIDFFNNCMSINKLEDFKNIRIISEQRASLENNCYNLSNIYKFIQEHYKLSFTQTINYLNQEIDAELNNIYPIYNNINKLNSDSIITVEHYYNSEQIKKFLSKFNIINIPIYTSNETNSLKSDGTLYNYLKKFYKIKIHTGSNYNLDYEVPNSLKIKANYVQYNYHPLILNIQNKLKDNTKNYFKMIESYCESTNNLNLWNLQLYYNLPLLIYFSNTILNFCKDNQVNNVVFLSRNCYMLKKIFDTIYLCKKDNINDGLINTSELVVSFKLFENKKYLKKMLSDFKSDHKYLFIDFNDCFTNYLNNFFKAGYGNEPYFYNIFNNRLSSINLINAYSLFTNDFESTKIIELLNLPNNGPPIDFVDNKIIYDNLEFNINLVDIYMKIVNLLNNTIKTEIINDICENYLCNIIDNLTKIKLIINDLVEYNDLKNIFNINGNNCIKIDYHDKNFVDNIENRGQKNPYLKVIKI